VTFAPASIVALQTFWQGQGGVALGIVGNQKHCAGYHLGRDRIYGECACRPDGTCEPGQKGNDYSVQLPRDRSGLSNAASAIDLGRLNGSLGELQDFSRWLVRACMADREAYRDIREVIYSPDGVTVQRYSGVDNEIHYGAGNGDGSHTTHTHISFYRDSVGRDKVALFAAYFVEVDMPNAVNGGARILASDYVRSAKAGTALYRDTSGSRLSTLKVDSVLDDMGIPVGTPGWAYVLVRSAGFDADAEMEAGLALVKIADVGPLRRKTTAELAATAGRFAAPADCSTRIAEAIAADRAKARIVWE
jgi:hypothetical protein